MFAEAELDEAARVRSAPMSVALGMPAVGTKAARLGAPARPCGTPATSTGRPARALRVGSIWAPAVGETTLPRGSKGVDPRIGETPRSASVMAVESCTFRAMLSRRSRRMRMSSSWAWPCACPPAVGAPPVASAVLARKKGRSTMFTTFWSAE